MTKIVIGARRAPLTKSDVNLTRGGGRGRGDDDGGGGDDGEDDPDDNIKSCMCLNFPCSHCDAEAVRGHTNTSNIDMIYVLRCGGSCPGPVRV